MSAKLVLWVNLGPLLVQQPAVPVLWGRHPMRLARLLVTNALLENLPTPPNNRNVFLVPLVNSLAQRPRRNALCVQRVNSLRPLNKLFVNPVVLEHLQTQKVRLCANPVVKGLLPMHLLLIIVRIVSLESILWLLVPCNALTALLEALQIRPGKKHVMPALLAKVKVQLVKQRVTHVSLVNTVPLLVKPFANPVLVGISPIVLG
mmetsp:Transcript_8627/g.16515  ORF Transcript_8627/g.16515 Transcript_8627/m.16515 type:complete len:204 (+) Transcript_8627:296-907(+)